VDIIGTQFSITLGTWRLHFNFAIEETEERAPQAAPSAPHRLYVRGRTTTGARPGDR
jgi:hypothetical protein